MYDDNNQPAASAQNVSSAISDGAVAVIEDGLGAAVSAPKSAAAGVPEIDIANGTAALMDPQNRPSLFRLGIANDAAATLLGTYLVQTTKHVAIIHDDSDSGRQPPDQLTDPSPRPGHRRRLDRGSRPGPATFDAQLQTVTSSGAGALAVWEKMLRGQGGFSLRARRAPRCADLHRAHRRESPRCVRQRGTRQPMACGSSAHG